MSKDFFNSRAAIWDNEVAEKDISKLQAMLRRLAIEPGATVLDVGTGTGVFVPYLLASIGKQGRLVCLDYASDMLNQAKRKYAGENIEFVCADINNNLLASEVFDAVVCYSSFPHFEEKPGALREIYRVLKPGGCLYICHTSSRAAINAIHCQIPEVCMDIIPAAIEMQELLAEAGFCCIDICDEPEQYFASARKK